MVTNFSYSFEFFPPRTEELEQKLWQAVSELEPLHPSFVSVTYGAGGTTRDRTHRIVKQILDETTLTPAAHLTCVAASQREVDAVARGYWDAGIRHIVALRGDPPPEQAGNFVPHPEGYRYSCDLVAGLKRIGDFEISVAAFPEKHPTSPSLEFDLEVMKKKIAAGATRAITQYFFEPDLYFRYVEKARAAGITIPIVPGILPINHFGQMVKFSAMCGASVPDWVKAAFEGLDDKPEERARIAADLATDLCQKLLIGGANHLHFYTLNRAELTSAVLRRLTSPLPLGKRQVFLSERSEAQ